MTIAAYDDCVSWSIEDSEKQGVAQDESGRLFDVLFMLRIAIRKHQSGELIHYQINRVPKKGKCTLSQKITLKAVVHGGDDCEPVITIMLPNED